MEDSRELGMGFRRKEAEVRQEGKLTFVRVGDRTGMG